LAARLVHWIIIVVAASALLGSAAPVHAQSRLTEFAKQATPQEFFAQATRFGDPQGDPPLLPVFANDDQIGFVYLNSDFTGSVGYSGKPVHILVAIDMHGVIAGFKLVEHKEPIVLVGVPERRVVEALNKLVGTKIGPIAAGAERPPQPDIVSGATVTVLVMADSIVRSAVRLIRSGRISPGGAGAPARAGGVAEVRTVDMSAPGGRDWQSLLGDGSVRRLRLSLGDVNTAFERSGNKEAAANPEQGGADETFIDLYAALASVPAIGKSLLGEAGYERLRSRLKPGQQAIIVAAEGRYSFKGSGYVRGGIFDRIEIQQDGSGTRFRDRNHERLGAIEAAGAPALREISLFVVPDDLALDPIETWTLQLMVQRPVGPRDKAFLTFDLTYTLPSNLTKAKSPPVATGDGAPVVAKAAPPAPAPELAAAEEDPLWKEMWRRNAGSVAVTAVAIAVLTGIFFFQNALVRRPVVYTWARRAFLTFTLVWLGWYANAQLSVVNVLTFTNALLTGFSWEYFLAAPLIFILWSSVAVSLLFWGRGPFCGWLCPFGALQELTNSVAKALGVPQLRVAWDLHERLWPIKYVIFIGLFGLSLYSFTGAEHLAEVEPFKTAIVLKFMREWPFVVFALALLTAGLFVERFFCRYLCPLGAALAIPGRMRMFEWLRRWPECGSPCQRCSNECPVQSIHPNGRINVNECIYCMHCQELYFDDHRCPHMIQVRLKREKRDALLPPSQRGLAGPPRPLITYVGKIIHQPSKFGGAKKNVTGGSHAE
jgi:NosR/NirI family nitrous oxide reductase transcriptional regulator